MLVSNNITALKSQKQIIKAFSNLMNEMTYDDITVTAICYESHLDRRTFYRNFDSKNDVLENYIISIKEDYLQFLSFYSPTDEYTLTKLFFEFWFRNIDFIKNIQKCALSDFVFKYFKNFSKEYISILSEKEVLSSSSKYLITYKIGGFWNTMLEWISDDCVLSPEDISKLLCTRK